MYTSIVFIGYMVALFIATVNIAVIVASLINRNIDTPKQYQYFFAFIIACVAYSLVYFVFFYRESTLGLYDINLPLRWVDFFLSAFLVFMWVYFINSLNGKTSNKSRLIIAGFIFSILRVIISLVITTIYMNDYYMIENQFVAKSFFIIEFILVLSTLIVLVLVFTQVYKQISSLRVRVFVTIISVGLFLLEIVPTPVSYNLYTGQFYPSAWESETVDFNGILFIIINLTSLAFLLSENFSIIYISSFNNKVTDNTIFLDQVSEKFNLTSRESEILVYVYEGYSNPEIAEKLFISKYTVKRHIHNIFEKLNIKSRIELIHLLKK